MADATFDNLLLNGNLRLSNKTIWLREGDDIFNGIVWKWDFGNSQGVNGPIVFGWEGGALGTIQNGVESVTLRWSRDFVTVGTPEVYGHFAVLGTGGIHRFRVNGISGEVTLRDADNNVTLQLLADGTITTPGDVILTGADCAEDFDVFCDLDIEPGTVMVIGKDGVLEPSKEPYDKRVAGVISGAGDLRPGITLGKKEGVASRLPIALNGKVYCKVDAQYGPIEVGDLLTTSPTCGHAMKAMDREKAFGTVIGKALSALADGIGILPILVSLQ